MQIPKSFQLLSHTWEVKIVEHDHLDSGNVGLVRYYDHEIFLKKGEKKGENLETFFHEVCHLMLRHIGVTKQDGGKLHEDEDVVDLMGEMLAQICKTMKD